MVKEAIFLDLPLRCSLVLATKECVSRIFLEAGTNKIHFLRQPPEIWHLLNGVTPYHRVSNYQQFI